MSKEKKERVVNMTDMSEEKVAEASKLRLDEKNMNFDEEGKFLVEVINVPDSDDAKTTRVEIQGNRELVIAAIIGTVQQDESFRSFMFTLVDSVMIARLSEVTGMTKEEIIKQADMAAKEAEQEGVKIPMAKGGDA